MLPSKQSPITVGVRRPRGPPGPARGIRTSAAMDYLSFPDALFENEAQRNQVVVTVCFDAVSIHNRNNSMHGMREIRVPVTFDSMDEYMSDAGASVLGSTAWSPLAGRAADNCARMLNMKRVGPTRVLTFPERKEQAVINANQLSQTFSDLLKRQQEEDAEPTQLM